MGAFGILGGLAQGYTDAAKTRREQNLALGEHQRDLQIGLLDKLLADPSTPEEYKGALLQHRIATTNASQYDKNGMLKLPSLDDMRQALPPVQRPQPQPVQAPAITLPSAPPTAALPSSGIQKPAGTPSIPLTTSGATAPPMLPAMSGGGSPVNLPASQVTLPTPPPIAEAGQFHALTQQEQIQRQTQLAIGHAQQLMANGVPQAQAYVAAGLMPKPELHNIPFLGMAINPYTGQSYGAGNGSERPKGVPQVFQTPEGLATLQQVQTGDGKYHWEDLQGNVTVPQPGWTKLVPSTLPTDRTSTTSDEFGTKSTTSTRTQKVVPGGKAVSGAKSTGAVPDDGLTPAERRAQFQNNQAATKKIQQDAIKASADVRNMVNLLDTQTDYMNGIEKGQAPTPRQDLSLIVAAVRAMNPGTVRLPQKELELELKAGSYGDRFRRQWDTATQGILPDDQRKDLFSVVNNETTKAATNAASNWQQAMGRQPLPTHLKRFANGSITKPSAPPNAPITVTDPNGGQHVFPDQASADKFKQLAGIK